jgi:hypothetical protein
MKKKKKSAYGFSTRWWNFKRKLHWFWAGNTREIKGRYGSLLVVDHGFRSEIGTLINRTTKSVSKAMLWLLATALTAGIGWFVIYYLSKHFK